MAFLGYELYTYIWGGGSDSRSCRKLLCLQEEKVAVVAMYQQVAGEAMLKALDLHRKLPVPISSYQTQDLLVLTQSVHYKLHLMIKSQ